MTKYRNDLNQLAKRIVETATGERLEVIGMREEPMRVYLVVCDITPSDPLYACFVESINKYENRKISSNVWLVAYKWKAELLYHEIDKDKLFARKKLFVSQVTKNIEIKRSVMEDDDTIDWLFKIGVHIRLSPQKDKPSS